MGKSSAHLKKTLPTGILTGIVNINFCEYIDSLQHCNCPSTI